MTPGPGESPTWPQFAGHPHDPRFDDDFERPVDDEDEDIGVVDYE